MRSAVSPLALITVAAVAGLATYVALAFWLRWTMGPIAYAVCCSISFLVTMAWWGVFTHWLVYDIKIGWLTVLLILGAIFFIGCLIERRDHRLGRLREPQTRFDRWCRAIALWRVEKSPPSSELEQAKQLPPSSEP